MEAFFIVIAIVGVLVTIAWLRFRSSDDGEQQIIDSLVHTEDFLYGTIKSRSPVSPEVVEGIYDAFQERIEKGKERGWTNFQGPFEILVFPSVRDWDAYGTYSPSFQVFIDKDSPYWGSEWDRGGYVLAAERVITKGDQPTNTFIIAQNDSREYSCTATSNGLDHIFAAKNDWQFYLDTRYHTNGVSHPLY